MSRRNVLRLIWQSVIGVATEMLGYQDPRDHGHEANGDGCKEPEV